MKDIKLVERIGIDRSVLYDFGVIKVDTEKLKKNLDNNDSGRSYTNIVYDDHSPIQLANGKRIGKLIIKDSRIGKLKVSFERSNLSKKQYVNCSLEITVSDGSNNLQNLDTLSYQKRILDVFQDLEERYGVTIDYSTISVKRLEINATFFLKESYDKYKQPLLLLIRNVPVTRYGKDRNSNSVKYATWHEANMKTNIDRLETILVKNKSVELKIYNKRKHLEDIGILDNPGRDIMRVEYTIKDRRILKHAFGDNLVSSMTDEKITNLFKKYFNRDIVAPYYQWASKNHQQLLELTKKHRSQYQKWTSTFFRECRQYEAVHGLPILFDIDDMESVINELEQKKTGRNRSHKFDKFKEQAVYEKDLVGNTARVKEIIKKIESMYT